MGLTNQIPSSRLIQPGVCTSTTRPASPYEGQAIYETDTDRMLIYNGSIWIPTGGKVPSCRVARVAALTPGSNVAITWDTESWDTDAMFSASSDTITIKTAGNYAIYWNFSLSGTSGTVVPNLTVNGGETGGEDINSFGRTNLTYIYNFAANDALKFRVFFTGGTFTATGANVVVQYLGVS